MEYMVFQYVKNSPYSFGAGPFFDMQTAEQVAKLYVATHETGARAIVVDQKGLLSEWSRQ